MALDPAREAALLAFLGQSRLAWPLAPGVEVPASWILEGLRLVAPRTELVVLSERGDVGAGLGQLVWRATAPKTGAKAWVLQAPHRFFDRGTARVALAIFADADPRNASVLMMNAKHRYARVEGEPAKSEHNPSDVCHNDSHGFQRVTQTLLDVLDSRSLVQLHGFSEQKAGRGDALAIVSSGDAKAPSAQALALVKALRASFGEKVLLFPRDTLQLGATTNVQGRMLRSARGGTAPPVFLHIELSKTLRARLMADPKALAQFRTALFEVLGGARN